MSEPRPQPGGPTPVSQAAELMNGGQRAFRTSVSGELRGPLCGMGVCFECRNEHEAEPHHRTCQTPAGKTPTHQDAPSVERIATQVLVVGAGPAGMAAAVHAAESGRQVMLVDDNPGRGGQLWRGEEAHPKAAVARAWFERLAKAAVTALPATTIIGKAADGSLVADGGNFIKLIRAEKTIIATGARELFLPFPGWTHPQVLGAGGLQALTKSGLDVRGRTILVAGSGPLLLAVAANLRQRGARVPLLAEQAPWASVFRLGCGLVKHPAKLLQAVSLQAGLAGVAQHYSCWPIRVEPIERQIRVTFRKGKRTFTQDCDELACGWGLVPNTELLALLGCRVDRQVARVDEWQETTRSGIYTVGETTGVAGVEAALISGTIAGLAAAGRQEEARQWFAARAEARQFGEALARAYALRPELGDLPDDDTLVCRCEDVPWGRLRHERSWKAAKLQTRCGMGACQGRTCGTALTFLRGWETPSTRPPLFPTSVAALQALASAPEAQGQPGKS